KRIWRDEWGTGWEDDGYGEKAEIFPMRDGYPQNLDYAWPDATHPKRFLELDQRLQQRGDKYVQAAVWFTLFERMWMLRGFNNILIDPYLEPQKFLWLRDKIMEFNLAMVDLWLKRGVHAVFFSDDWGSQNSLMINPDDWRRLFRPCYQQLFSRVRDAGAHVWYHSCGNVTQIIPDLLDLGVNVLHPIQPQAMDVSALARDYGGKVCFFGGVDVQGTLIHGSTDDVRNEVHRLVDTLGNYNGGYIGGTSHSVMPETPIINIVAMLETFLEYSV
ncbi:hypothetical protein KAH55_00920, partial [bacterium]|nr:hypothetical protein [bacterium]